MSTSHTADSDSEVNARSQQSPLASRRPTGELPREDASKSQSRFSRFFPLGYKEGFSQWWSASSAADCEHRVLSFVPSLQSPPTHTQTGSEPPSVSPSATDVGESITTTNSITDPYGPRRWHSRMVPLSGKNRALNEFSVEKIDQECDQNLVILHGYGAGLGFFYKNFEPLSRPAGWQLYALDMLGMGRSSRPPFKIHAKSREDQITEAEDWFVDSLEEWRIKKKIGKMTLVGHSMGGYMAVCYALKYPGNLNKLVLASPVGIPEDPYAVQADMPDPQESTLQAEFTQDQTESTKPAQASNPNRIPTGENPPPRRQLPKWLTYLWDANISPFSFVRWSGPLGPRLVSGWTSRRFSHLPSDEALALHDYAYSLFRLRGSGEYALAYILAPGAFARSPLIRRIQGVGRQTMPNTDNVPEPTFPVVLMYGENDWMDIKGGYAAKNKLDAERKRVLGGKSAAEQQLDRGNTKVVMIKKAGHHVYLDNPDDFNKAMIAEMEDVRANAAKSPILSSLNAQGRLSR